MTGLLLACTQEKNLPPQAELTRAPDSTTAAPSPSALQSPSATTSAGPDKDDEEGGEESDDSVTVGDRPKPERGLTQGEIYFGVYFALADDPEDPSLEAAIRRLEQQGYAVGSGQLGCDQGAAEALGVEEDDFGVGLYFKTRSDAQRFAELSDPPPLGSARVKIFCAD